MLGMFEVWVDLGKSSKIALGDLHRAVRCRAVPI